MRLPAQAARQLPDQSTTLRVDSSSTDDSRLRGALPKPDGSGRAVGTVLAGLALESIKAGNAYYGQVPILGTPYITGYEPIRDSSGAQIGVYYVGYWFCWFCRYRSN
jgi:Single cache domain 3